MSRLLAEKRKSRGLRMADLVGKAAEEDDQFWNSEVWGEDESDDSFSEEELKPDVFDADFNDSEDDSDDDDDDASVDKKRSAENDNNKKSANRYKEPVKRIAHKRTIQDVEKTVESTDTTSTTSDNKIAIKKEKKKLHRLSDSTQISTNSSDENQNTSSTSFQRQIRDSTKVKSEEMDIKIKHLSHQKKIKDRKKVSNDEKPSFHQFTQKELLLDALETEKHNKIWIESQKFDLNDASSNGQEAFKTLNHAQNNSMIRKLSRRGTYNTITFTDDKVMPSFLRRNNTSKLNKCIIPNKVCAITGLVAKYKDPLTGLPYANLEAFRELRKKFPAARKEISASL